LLMPVQQQPGGHVLSRCSSPGKRVGLLKHAESAWLSAMDARRIVDIGPVEKHLDAIAAPGNQLVHPVEYRREVDFPQPDGADQRRHAAGRLGSEETGQHNVVAEHAVISLR